MLNVAGENGEHSISGVQGTKVLGIVMNADYKWAEQCNAPTRRAKGSSSGYGPMYRVGNRRYSFIFMRQGTIRA